MRRDAQRLQDIVEAADATAAYLLNLSKSDFFCWRNFPGRDLAAVDDCRRSCLKSVAQGEGLASGGSVGQDRWVPPPRGS